MWGCHGYVSTVTKYTANTAKTWNGAYDAAATYHKFESSVGAVMEYTADQMKTEKQLYVTGINCADEPSVTARQFNKTKSVFGKTDGLQCMHGYQSFKPGEVTPEVAHKIGVELAKRVWGDEFEVLVSTHLNTGAIHNHFVLNSISFVDGHRYHCNQASYKVMREESDKLCREYDMSVIENPKNKRTNRYLALLEMERQGKYTIHTIIKNDIDLALAAAPRDFDEFISLMEEQGYRLERRGKDLRIIPSIGKSKPRRLRSLGEGYSEEDIEYRIRSQWYDPQRIGFRLYRPKGKVPTSLHGLYVHYCFLLGIYPKERPQSKVAQDYLKEDKMRAQMYSDEAAMMGKYGIETMDDLREHYLKVSTSLEEKRHQRKGFRNSLRRMTDEADKEYTKAQVKVLTTDIRRLERELHLCQDITFRSAGIEEVVRLIEEPEKQKETLRREKEKNESKR